MVLSKKNASKEFLVKVIVEYFINKERSRSPKTKECKRS